MYWQVFVNKQISPTRSTRSAPTPPLPLPPVKLSKLATIDLPVIVLDTNCGEYFVHMGTSRVGPKDTERDEKISHNFVRHWSVSSGRVIAR